MRDESAGSSELSRLLVSGLKSMCETIRITVLRIAFVVLTLGQMSSGKRAVAVESASLTDVAAASDEAACFNFSVGAPVRREFYSPNYPNHYPKNTKCTLRITADAGHMVMLDFRDQFRLEQSSTCEYDRLEVRDGAYGYSPLIGKFCGPDFPSKLYSSKRYMWLQFSSDDSIEYEGFRAVYDYVPVPNQGQNGHDNDRECAYHRSGSSGLIEKSEIDLLWQKYRQEDTIECMWTIETEAGKQLYMNFIKYHLDKPNDCDQNFVQLFGDGRTPDKQLNKFCGTTAEPQKSPGNVTHVRLFTHRSAFNGTDFSLHYTAFREIKKEEQCDPRTEFNCGDQTCVDISLKCDGQFDCKYRYDEEPTLCARALGAGMVLTSEHMIIILVVFFSLVAAMCASISISCYNKVRERRTREREYKERRSKEASVEATLSSASVPPSAQLSKMAAAHERMADDESSDGGGCYVPELDMSVFGKQQQQRPNGGDTIPKKPRGQQQQHYPYISESFESLASDVIVPPAPPPVPVHLRGGPRRDPSPPPPSYRIVAGKVVANPAKNEPTLAEPSSRTSTLEHNNRIRPVEAPKSSWLRGPLESGAPPPNRPLGPAKYGMASRVTPDGPRGPLAGLKDRPTALGPRPYQASTPVGDASDSSRAHSVASTLSAPDALLGKR